MTHSDSRLLVATKPKVATHDFHKKTSHNYLITVSYLK